MPRREDTRYLWKVGYLFLFAVAMGFLEAAVVVYLRELYYPEGFTFPLKEMPQKIITIELLREVATMVMLLSAAAIASRRFWERFGYFIYLFGIWDIFYYLWLKSTIGWPSSIFDWDILFLIPSPWIGPVAAPISISILFIIMGLMMSRLYHRGLQFRTTLISWVLGILGTIVIIYSFIQDTGAAFYQKMPQPYLYWLLGIGLITYVAGFYHSYRRSRRHT